MRRLPESRAAAALLAALLVPASAVEAGKADVLEADVRCEEGECVFSVTVRHGDAGWDHYADRWEILAPDGSLLGTRVLAHPHVGEQPFTRRLPGVRMPPDVDRVRIRAHDSVHGYGGVEREVRLPAPGAPGLPPPDESPGSPSG